MVRTTFNPDKDKIAELLKTHTIAQIAEKYGVSPKTLSIFMKKKGLHGNNRRCKLDSIKDKVIALLKDNNIKDTAKLLDVSAVTLQLYMKKHGIKASYKKEYLNDKLDPVKDSIPLLLKNNSIADAAAQLGVSLHVLAYYIKRNGLGLGVRKIVRKSKLDANKAEVIALLKRHTVAECARLLDVSQNAVKAFIKKHEISDYRKMSDQQDALSSQKSKVIALLAATTITEAASILGVTHAVLSRFMKKHGLQSKNTK